MNLLPITSWEKGWSKRSMTKIRTICRMPSTMEGYLAKVFKGWKTTLNFRGRANPVKWQQDMHFIEVPGWSDFMDAKS